MSAIEHYAAPSHVAPSGGFATGDASKEDKGKENRDRYHWNEWDLTQNGGWLKDWLELNMDQKTIYDGSEYLIRLRNCYRDTGEAVINQRKGKMFATYKQDVRCITACFSLHISKIFAAYKQACRCIHVSFSPHVSKHFCYM